MPRPLLYFIRHGETDWNAEGRVQGSRDIPPNTKCIGQASATGAGLRGLNHKSSREPVHFDYVASPLGRARHTMDLLRVALGLPSEGYRLVPDVREIA